MAAFIPPEPVKYSEYLTDSIPAGAIAVDVAYGPDTTVLGFYERDTGVFHAKEAKINTPKTGE